MTMMQKVQAKRSKKGFTLVELVIVIAILAILAAIAIPVITTTINSSKLYTMESDRATLNMLLKEAINTSKASITTTKWNGATAAEATVGDVCAENDLDDSENFYSRVIGGETYELYWSDNDDLYIHGGDYEDQGGEAINAGTEINTLSEM